MTDIFLRELERADLPILTGWRSDRDLVSLLGGSFRHVGSEVDSRWYDAYLNSRANNVRLAICRADDRKMIGVVYLLGIDWINRCTEFSIQIGEASARGHGVGMKASRIALAHAFDDLNLRRIHLTVLASNARARSLYERIGFRAEGLFEQAAYKNGAWVDVIPMALRSDSFRHSAEPPARENP
ncbi:MAG: GNAT family protein [Paraburkholderia tropica]|uniref:GNAT family N-acetyltransferase n=1 Tax=Burkholderia gladioli TaxID=28095 RepID=UPI0016411330|nr:GNAT family protein [Burkholderia gladioli]URV25037.1 GNAT family N-acetyltransferase [Burkholderia gladioli]